VFYHFNCGLSADGRKGLRPEHHRGRAPTCNSGNLGNRRSANQHPGNCRVHQIVKTGGGQYILNLDSLRPTLLD